MPLQATSGAASYDAFGGGVPVVPNYIEDVYSTYLYTGTGANQTITNGVDLSGNGGLIWTKFRSGSFGTQSHGLYDTARGVNKGLISNTTDAELTGASNTITAFNSNGYTMGADSTYGLVNYANQSYVSWTFRKQPKFFDVVTYTGTGSARTIAHNLGSVPGWMMVKKTSSTGDWVVYHRSLGATKYLILNTTAREDAYIGFWNDTEPTSSVFSIGTDGLVNASGATYVAYLFAHNAGGFGLTGTDNVISCGSFTTDGSGYSPDVNLGYEPQWIMFKRTNSSTFGSWQIVDTMRGWVNNGGAGDDYTLLANSSNAEGSAADRGYPTATGFNVGYTGATSSPYIYIAIRRGPMKVPTSGTSVFDIQQYTGTQSSNPGVARNITTTIRTDVNITSAKTPGFDIGVFFDRLRGPAQYIGSNSTNSEGTMPGSVAYEFWNNKYILGGYYLDYTGYQYVNYSLQRAPSFFDEVCYTNPASSPVDQTHSHNLGVVPTLVITKGRNQTGGWIVLLDSSILGSVKYMYLNTTAAAASGLTYSATSTQYTTSFIGNYNETQVAYLFATCAGVSKVGSYTGNGSTQTIDCGFTGGARFVLIKRTDSTGDWYTYDTVRGMTTLTDPYLLLNSTAAESATLGSVTTVSTGFALNAGILAAINTNGASYIFLAIA